MTLDLPSVEWAVDLRRTEHVVDTSLFFGTNHWPNTPELKAKFLPNLRKCGIRLIRGDMMLQALVSKAVCPDTATFWKRIGEPGFIDSWDWKQLGWIDEVRAEGFKVLALEAYIPECFTVNGTLPTNGDEQAWKGWGEVCYQAAKRVEKKVDAFEIFNEAHFFTKADKTGYKRTIDADPDIYHYAHERLAKVTKKPLGGPATWIDVWAGSALETLPFDPRSKPKNLDYFSIHIYDTPLKTFLSRFDKTRAVLDGTLPSLPSDYKAPWKSKPIWLTEWDFYWENPQVGMEWYGFILAELLSRGINNCLYNYQENFDPKDADLQKPWRLLVECGLNAKSQKVRVHPLASSGSSEDLTSACATLPDGSIVLIAANAGLSERKAHWYLKGMDPKPRTVQVIRAIASYPNLDFITPQRSEAKSTLPGPRDFECTLPAKSMVALRLVR